MLRMLGLLWFSATILAMAPGVQAAEVSTWIDANGVRHFGDAQFGEGLVERITVEDANAMDAPDTSVLARKATRKGAFMKISKAEKSNKKGFRGHQSSRRGYNSRTRSHR